MTLPIHPELWHELCALQARYPTCKITLLKHEQVINTVEVLITLKVGACERRGTGSDGMAYVLEAPRA